MTFRNTVVRSLHDAGLAAWFGGSLMGAVGLNGGTATAIEPRERLRLSSNGWAAWSPWQIGAVAAHTIGGVGLIVANRGRLQHQAGAQANTVIKLAVTGIAAAATAYSGYLGHQLQQRQSEGAAGVTEPAAGSSDELASAQQQLKILQWATPALTAVLVVLGAQQGEQQRGIHGLADKVSRRKSR